MPQGEFPDRARHAAFARLGLQAEVFPQLGFEGPDTAGLTELDAAFAHAIYDAVLRRWFTLEYLVRGCLEGDYPELEPQIKACLVGGAAQLLLLDRVPLHAAVNETVNWAKWSTNPRAGGLVNAVLRRLIEAIMKGQTRQLAGAWNGETGAIPLSDGTSLLIGDAKLPEDSLERLAVATSHPRTLLGTWVQQFGEAKTRQIALHDLANPPTVLNIGDARAEDVGCVPHKVKGHGVFRGTRAELMTLLKTNPAVWAQDTSSSGAVESVADLKPGLVIDVCAGQGTKTRQLARMFPNARIIASDTDRRRRAKLEVVAAANPQISVLEPHMLGKLQSGTADLVLLDVPCTNTGVLARRVEGRYRFDEEQMRRMVETQREIFSNSMRLLKPGGAILYATCSLEHAENEALVEWVESGGQFEAERVRRVFPEGQPGGADSEYCDGAFSVLLRHLTNPKKPRKKRATSAKPKG